MIARVLFWWGCTICSLFVVASLLSALLEIYQASGIGGVMFGVVLLSGLPALFAGLVMSK